MEANGKYSFTMLFEPAEEGGYTVTCPALPGLVTEGDTLEEARVMADDAIRAYLESLSKDSLPAPPNKMPLIGGGQSPLPWGFQRVRARGSREGEQSRGLR